MAIIEISNCEDLEELEDLRDWVIDQVSQDGIERAVKRVDDDVVIETAEDNAAVMAKLRWS